jgi:hypothetical protein
MKAWSKMGAHDPRLKKASPPLTEKTAAANEPARTDRGMRCLAFTARAMSAATHAHVRTEGRAWSSSSPCQKKVAAMSGPNPALRHASMGGHRTEAVYRKDPAEHGHANEQHGGDREEYRKNSARERATSTATPVISRPAIVTWGWAIVIIAARAGSDRVLSLPTSE